MSNFDPIQKAAHYNQHPSGVECIEIIRHLPADLANAFKYVFRYRYKGRAAQDLRKAVYYLRDQARHCGVATDAIPDRVARLALEVANSEYDWRISDAIKRMISARSVGEYQTAADLVESVVATVEECPMTTGGDMNPGVSSIPNQDSPDSPDLNVTAFRRAALRLAGIVERLAEDVHQYRRRNRELETRIDELSARVVELESGRPNH